MQLVPDDAIRRIVTRTLRQGGATFDLASLSFVRRGDFWYFPKYPSRTQMLDPTGLHDGIPAFLERNRDVCTDDGVWLGTWINPHSGQCYLDITIRVADKDEAIGRARRISEDEGRKIVTIYNPGLGRTEYVWAGVTR